MAEERTVVVDVGIEGEFDQQIGIVNTEIKENRKEIKELSKDYEKNASTIASLEGSNKKLAASKRDLTKENNIQKGSLSQLRNELSKQVKARNEVNLSTKEGKERFAEMNLSIKGLNDEISGFEQAGGDFRRNVGNYPKLLGNAVGGINVFGTSLGGLFTMIATNPIGILIAAITGLIAVFAKSQSGAEFFRKAGAALSATLGLLSDIVESLGNAMIKAFEDPQKTLDELVQNIKDGIVFYFTEFIPNAINKVIEGFGLLGTAAKQLFEGDFDAALETGKEAVTALADGITDLNPVTAALKAGFEAAVPALQDFIKEVDIATEAAFGLETQLIANEKALADLRVSEAQSIQEQKRLNRIIEDTTKTFEERIEAAEEFGRVEAEQIAESIRLQEERIKILEKQNALTNSTEEDLQRVRDAEIELANLRAASDERAVTNANKLNTIRNQIQAEEDARKAEELKAIEVEQKAKERAAKEATARELKAIAIEKAAKEKAAREEEQRDKAEIARKKATQQANFTAVSSGLSSIAKISGENEEILKGIALTEIGIDTARAIAGLVAASEANPTNAVTFGGSAILQFASGMLRIGANIAGAISILKGSGSSSAISSGGGGAPSAPASIGQNVNAQLLTQFSGDAQQGQQNANAARDAVSNLPPIQVAVTEIEEGIAAHQATVTESNLG